MFEYHDKNINSLESKIRIIITIVLLIAAVGTQCYLLAFVSFLLFYTAISKFCFLYYFFKINERFSIKNYYLSHLPKHNPFAVYMFNDHGEIIFKNSAATKKLNHISAIRDFGIDDFSDIIHSKIKKNIICEYNDRTYQVKVLGVKNEKFILAYVNDVTPIVELNNEMKETQRGIIYAMGQIGETRSQETGNHVKRVALYSELLALKLGLTVEESKTLKMASPMHDIGKVGIADSILNKPAKLTDDEFVIMKTHSLLGYNMLKNSNKPILKAAATVAYEHHEKYDGSGYPRGLKGEEIHIFGRITAVADVFDALSSKRVYKKAWPLEDILQFFKEQSGQHFDPKLIELFIQNLDDILLIKKRYCD